MKMTLNANDLKDLFRSWNRDYYSWEGVEALLEYYDEIDPNMEVDIIGICCDCTEYGDGAACTLDNLIDDYCYAYDKNEYMQDNNIALSDFDKDDYITALIDVLQDYTTVLQVSNGNYIVFSY